MTTAPELSIVFCDNTFIHELNLQWRNEDKPTDVLSFPLYEAFQIPKDAMAIGDIIISIEYAEKTCAEESHRRRMEDALQQKISNWTLEKEIIFLLIHGLLHLVGYDHLEKKDEIEMKKMEAKLWNSI